MRANYNGKTWIRGQEIERHDHEIHYECCNDRNRPKDKYYNAIWIEIDGEFSEVTDEEEL